MRYILALVVAFVVGAGCRLAAIDAPSPPTLRGALLVVALTLGYIAGAWLKAR